MRPHKLLNMCTICQSCGKLFRRFPRKCTEWNLVSRPRKVSTLELLAPANIRSRSLPTEVELQNQCAQLEKLKSTNSLLQKDLVELRQKLDKHCDNAKEATREALGKLSAACEALRDNLKAAAARNAEQEQSIDLLKQELADLKVNTDKKSEAMEKENDQLRSELQQLENYNQYLASECRRNDIIIEERESQNEGHRKVFIRDSELKCIDSACDIVRDFVGKKFCFKRSDQKTLPQNELVDAP